MKKDNLGDRMKQFYETVPKTRLMRRCPVIIRLDGKSAHTFTRGFDKPFDGIFRGAMQSTMKFLCENIQGCQLGYCQSDEITLVLIDYMNLDTQAWYDYEVQKMCSVSASMATLEFNRAFSYFTEAMTSPQEGENEVHHLAMRKGLMFDSRCFNVPKEEVCNVLYWRQLDAMRNSVQMIARTLFSHKELQGKSCEEIKQMIINWKYLPWESYPLDEQRGCCCVKGEKGWEIDYNIPIFAREREYVNSCILWEDKNEIMD